MMSTMFGRGGDERTKENAPTKPTRTSPWILMNLIRAILPPPAHLYNHEENANIALFLDRVRRARGLAAANEHLRKRSKLEELEINHLPETDYAR